MASGSDLLTRSVSNVTPKALAEKKLQAGKPLRVYLGIDATAPRLHLGHGVQLRKLQAFVEAGHEVILVIGSFTAMIGDPSGRDEMREPLDKKQVEENFKTYRKQAEKIVDFSKVTLRYNHEWLETLTFDRIIELASKFTAQQMLERDMFEKRLKEGKPIHLHEFFYPLMVGYDSVVLDVDCEFGGNDQYFNMLAGRTLQQAFGKREKFVLTTKLIEGTDGRKMSKSYDNCIYLDDSATDMFGKVMSIKDELMPTYFECCTGLPLDEVKTILKGSPRDAKERLAAEITTLYHGADAAKKAAAEFTAVFKEKGTPADIAQVNVKKGTPLIDVLVAQKLIASKSEARRLVEQGGITINDAVVKSVNASVEVGVVKVGKRKFLRIEIT